MAIQPNLCHQHLAMQLARTLYTGGEKDTSEQYCLTNMLGAENPDGIQFLDTDREGELVNEMKKAIKDGFISAIFHKLLSTFTKDEISDLLQGGDHKEESGERIRILKQRLRDTLLSPATRQGVEEAQQGRLTGMMQENPEKFKTLFQISLPQSMFIENPGE